MNTAMTVRCAFCDEEIRWNDQQRLWVHDVEEGRQVQIHARCIAALYERESPTESTAPTKEKQL